MRSDYFGRVSPEGLDNDSRFPIGHQVTSLRPVMYNL
jgi:hypothetical protein